MSAQVKSCRQLQIFYLLTTVPIAEQNNPTMNKHMIGLIGLKRSAEEIYDASAAALTLQAPRSLYTSPGYNNISQINFITLVKKLTNVAFVIADLLQKNFGQGFPL